MLTRPLLLSLPTEDRRLLGRVILPYFASRPEFGRVLFVGCAWYTRSYAALFREREYWTLDADPAKRRWGGSRHVVDSLARIGRHFAEASLDLVMCNGVFGWGLDGRAEVEAALEGCHASLRPQGVLMLGWNDVPAHRPFPLEECTSLKCFRTFRFGPFGSSTYCTRTRNRHTFDFYCR